MPRVTAVLFERCIKCSPPTLDYGYRHFIRNHLFYQAEIDEFDETIRRNLKIAWLNVSMDDGRVLTMQVDERVGQLSGPLHNVYDIKQPAIAPSAIHNCF